MNISDLRTKKQDELFKELETARRELADARKSLAAGELVNPRVISAAKKNIARIMTVNTANNHATKNPRKEHA